MKLDEVRRKRCRMLEGTVSRIRKEKRILDDTAVENENECQKLARLAEDLVEVDKRE
jgi:hypothetical protein